MSITIKYFGAIEDVTGIAEESVSLEQISSLEELKEHCLARYNDIKNLSFRLAVNQSLTDNANLKEGDEVAFLPPFAGG
ncbi:MAG: MoaD/ThiS family protein [Bacteroidota bacterium]